MSLPSNQTQVKVFPLASLTTACTILLRLSEAPVGLRVGNFHSGWQTSQTCSSSFPSLTQGSVLFQTPSLPPGAGSKRTWSLLCCLFSIDRGLACIGLWAPRPLAVHSGGRLFSTRERKGEGTIGVEAAALAQISALSVHPDARLSSGALGFKHFADRVDLLREQSSAECSLQLPLPPPTPLPPTLPNPPVLFAPPLWSHQK